MTYKRFAASFVATLAVLGSLTACGTRAHTTSPVATGPLARCSNVAVFLIADAAAIQETVRGAKEGFFSESGLKASDVTFNEQNAHGDPGNVQSIARLLAGSDSGLFIVLGTSATIALAQVERRRPIVTLGMADPVGSKVAQSLDHPGGNVTGSTDYVDPSAQLAQILRIEPAARRIGTVYDPSQPNAVKWVRDFAAAAQAANVTFVQAAASSSTDIGIAARSLVGRVDAIMVGNDANTLAGIAAVAATAKKARIPLYLNGGDVNTSGVFATLGPNYFEVGKVAGENAGKVCKGEDPGNLAFARPAGVTWGINTQTMSELGLKVPADILNSASK